MSFTDHNYRTWSKTGFSRTVLRSSGDLLALLPPKLLINPMLSDYEYECKLLSDIFDVHPKKLGQSKCIPPNIVHHHQSLFDIPKIKAFKMRQTYRSMERRIRRSHQKDFPELRQTGKVKDRQLNKSIKRRKLNKTYRREPTVLINAPEKDRGYGTVPSGSGRKNRLVSSDKAKKNVTGYIIRGVLDKWLLWGSVVLN